MTRNTKSDQDWTSAFERRLDRLRFDLHDGPQQDVHLLALDLSLFREQLLPTIARDPNRDRLIGRLDDLQAQLASLDTDLRRLAVAAESPFSKSSSLSEALSQITDAFASRTGIHPSTRLAGDFSTFTDSRQIALLAVIREALSNVRKHSEAATVTISLSADERGVEAQVVDDGRGFDPDTTLAQARRDGHLGVVGMQERVRMLGGETRIESRPGGPTVVSVALPPWPNSGHTVP